MTLKLLETFWSAQDGKNRSYKCGFLLLSGIILAFLLPYNSNGELDFVLGAGEWFAHVLILMMTTGPLGRLMFPRLIEKNASTKIAIILYATVNAAPVFLTSVIIDLLLVSYDAPFSYGVETYLGWGIESLLFTILVIGTLSTVAVKFELTSEEPKIPSSAPRSGQKFLNRLPPNLGTKLMCLEMEDHYLRVHTAQGNELLHMRMADAIIELANFPGLQVHRSWWVATDAIEIISKQNRDFKAHLKNGMIVPISRNRVDTLKEKGFL